MFFINKSFISNTSLTFSKTLRKSQETSKTELKEQVTTG